ncbi:DoxX family protein [Paenibacillus oenotherae]|uniref:DoxX family protein n=1 Tax=Paenibacillus oenotherae TaxID=1435645 RepID=A0ABS7D1R1_9BACL|nr:DoxX family protein [Paenibacillus oenotherae]MBW7473879.1 DoxX family protein [Paenibacillus oenotherae]
MNSNISKGRLWTARIMRGLVILFMLFDSISKFFKPAVVVEGTVELGFAEHHIAVIASLGLLSILLYAVPRTSFLGVVLLTGYFGGAIAIHVRMDSPLFSHTLSPVIFAALAWGGLWLVDERVRKLMPFVRKG